MPRPYDILLDRQFGGIFLFQMLEKLSIGALDYYFVFFL